MTHQIFAAIIADQLFTPAPGSAIHWLTNQMAFEAGRRALRDRLATAPIKTAQDPLAPFIDAAPLTYHPDDGEAERFRLELERDAATGDD